ncbi:hypothetical protein FC99_GL002400 [Levilactobacillus koreensis JCM 16448]|uniref:D-alanyl-D-alanine carboxypeptidase n=1 Tax=Levilactobacillus koreensis TaxID=637971 RepID=A0AAC9ER15_9LACO|nr:hypothetical protein [Levilactobacillus koreensis]AKP64619.1 hypothetical protein ABN16_06190 [Levilactobacillus koreensis]KRK91368.1 hypothetical protein FC99_GL002400 [Levilactobacillus koreensis JCM 16448]
MKKPLKLLLTLVLIAVGAAALPVTAQAKTTYQITSKFVDSVPYTTNMAKVKSNGVIWNARHTKKLYNLKNYPYTRWNVSNIVTKRQNGKAVSYYYELTSQTNPKVKGIAWSKYFTKIIAQNPASFSSDAAYLKYIQTDPSQRLTRAILKLYPNVTVSAKLSAFADTGAYSYIQKPAGFKDVTNISYIQNYQPSSDLWNTMGQPVAPRIKKMTAQLDAMGYTAEKRASFTGNIGIFIADEANDGDYSKDGLPTRAESEGQMTSYGMVLATPTK